MDLANFYGTYAPLAALVGTGKEYGEEAFLSFRARQIHIRIDPADLEGTASGEEYTRRVDGFEAIERRSLADWNTFCGFALQPCIPILRTLAPVEEAKVNYTIRNAFR